MFYDWRVLVMKWLFMPFSKKILVLPINKSDIDMTNKKLTQSYKSHNEPQSSHCLVLHEDAHLSNKWYKVKKLFSMAIQRYTSTSIHKYTLFL